VNPKEDREVIQIETVDEGQSKIVGNGSHMEEETAQSAFIRLMSRTKFVVKVTFASAIRSTPAAGIDLDKRST
jgi:hypothetical protein